MSDLTDEMWWQEQTPRALHLLAADGGYTGFLAEAELRRRDELVKAAFAALSQ